MNFQKTIIAGRLAHTPELKALPSGSYVATFSLATNRVWKDANDQKQEKVEWHNCKAFGKTAETLAKFAEGGQVLLVEGRNETSSWEDKDTQKKMYRTEVIIESFQFGERSKSRAEKKEKSVDHDNTWGIPYPTEDINPNDIPF
jgi:single-strand DNA-binding protein